tara:strand:+ start:260 stop:625 length:366 start_codon:yes stop_codon:yes gene_type:complete
MNKKFYIIIYLFIILNVNSIADEIFVDPFHKDLPGLTSRRTNFNAVYYPVKSLKLVGTLSSDKTNNSSFLPLAVFMTPNNEQMIFTKGQEIGKEKAIIVRINKDDILIEIDDKKLTIKVSN